MNLENWKINEVIEYIEIVNVNSADFIEEALEKFNLPASDFSSITRSQTELNWDKMNLYYKLYIDDKKEEIIKECLLNSKLSKYEFVIITYGWEEPVIKVPVKLFFDDWEGFVRSKLWQGFIFSEDYKLIIECSRDYYLHSNFEILPNSKINTPSSPKSFL